jgi:hypothetical protein
VPIHEGAQAPPTAVAERALKRAAAGRGALLCTTWIKPNPAPGGVGIGHERGVDWAQFDILCVSPYAPKVFPFHTPL